MEQMTSRLFTDKRFVRDSIDSFELEYGLFDVVSNMQSHHAYEGIDLYDGVFTVDDALDFWTYANAWWYIYAGDNPINKHTGAKARRTLLRNFIEAADNA